MTAEVIDELLEDAVRLSCTEYHSVQKIELDGNMYKVKMVDLTKQDKKDLENEAKIYEYLNKNNVCEIPNLVYQGNLDDMFYVLYIEFIDGHVIQFKNMSTKVRNNCKNALQLLHNNRVLHGDIRAENFIVRPDETVSLIDFQLSTISNDERKFKREMRDLMNMLELA